MNLWECEGPGCTSTAVGVGGAAGLRAIGWHFQAGSAYRPYKLFCPHHHPDGLVAARDQAQALQYFCHELPR